MHEEVKQAAVASSLAEPVAIALGRALVVLADRAEMMAAGGPDLRAVAGPCTTAQLRNIALCNALHEVHRSAAGMLPRMPAQAVEILG
jgi:hypothetical protein